MMPIRSRAAAAAVHILTALCAAVGVVLQCGFIGGKLNLAVLQYFTLMSNILCAVYFTGAAVHTLRRGGTWLPVCKGALVMAMPSRASPFIWCWPPGTSAWAPPS